MATTWGTFVSGVSHPLTAFPRHSRTQICCIGHSCQGIDLKPAEPDDANVRIFGVEHLTRQPWASRYILETRPDVVVVETAVGPRHGSQTGRLFSCNDVPDEGRAGFVSQTVCGLVERLSLNDEEGTASLWEMLEANLPGEQLVYVAALHVGADLVFGDRPKSESFLRVSKRCSIVDLDVGFGQQARSNYLDLVSDGYIRQRSSNPDEVGPVELIMLLEREAILCRTLHEASKGLGSDKTVVGVVGEEHVNVMRDLWSSGGFKTIIEKSQSRPSNSKGSLEEENAGFKYAILESLVRLSASEQVLNDLRNEMGEVPEEYHNDYWFMLELYGSSRMLLATLSKDELSKVCCGWQCDMWEVLDKYRKARPENGATTVDLDLITELRGLEVSTSA